jgi:hypothetical protein
MGPPCTPTAYLLSAFPTTIGVAVLAEEHGFESQLGDVGFLDFDAEAGGVGDVDVAVGDRQIMFRVA